MCPSEIRNLAEVLRKPFPVENFLFEKAQTVSGRLPYTFIRRMNGIALSETC
jgi:hypothetical protein